jgi:hypothetical protein
MVKYLATFLICLIFGNFINAKNFTKLNYQSYFTIDYTSKQNEYIAVNLSINLQKSDNKNVVIKVFYLWEKDTITEFFPINAFSSKTLKYIYLEKGKKIHVGLQVVGNSILDKISGDIEIKSSDVNDIKDNDAIIFAGGYASTLLDGYTFKVDVNELKSNKMMFDIITNENFNEDKLHIQISYTMPNGTFGTEKKSLDVNSGNFLTFEKKKHTLSFSNFIKQTGTYTFKIEFLNNTTILNGISEISVHPEN